MPRITYRSCKRCGRRQPDVGPISWTRQCVECGVRELEHNIIGLHTHSGPAFDRWRRAMAASVGGVLLDDQPEQG
jgi:hypothetical protein